MIEQYLPNKIKVILFIGLKFFLAFKRGQNVPPNLPIFIFYRFTVAHWAVGTHRTNQMHDARYDERTLPSWLYSAWACLLSPLFVYDCNGNSEALPLH
jgi:hypothetical protein